MSKKKLVCLLLACVLLFCGCSSSASGPKLEGKGFDSPDEAVLAYLDAMKKGDVNGMISTFAIETLVDNLDVAAYFEQIGIFNLSQTYPVRADDAYTRSILLLRRQAELNNQLMRQYFYFNTENENILSGAPMPFHEKYGYDTADQFFDDLMHPDWMDVLADMTYKDLLTKKQLSELLSNHYGRSLDDIEDVYESYYSDSMKEIYGCDDLSSVAITVHLNGKEYCLFMDVVCYDGKWYNYQQGGTIATLTGRSTFELGFVLIED